LNSYFFIFLYLEMNFESITTNRLYSFGYMSISPQQPTRSYNLYNFIQIFYNHVFIWIARSQLVVDERSNYFNLTSILIFLNISIFNFSNIQIEEQMIGLYTSLVLIIHQFLLMNLPFRSANLVPGLKILCLTVSFNTIFWEFLCFT